MTRRSYQIKAEQARNERFKTISVRLTPEEYEAFRVVAERRGWTPSGLTRALIYDAAREP